MLSSLSFIPPPPEAMASFFFWAMLSSLSFIPPPPEAMAASFSLAFSSISLSSAGSMSSLKTVYCTHTFFAPTWTQPLSWLATGERDESSFLCPPNGMRWGPVGQYTSYGHRGCAPPAAARQNAAASAYVVPVQPDERSYHLGLNDSAVWYPCAGSFLLGLTDETSPEQQRTWRVVLSVVSPAAGRSWREMSFSSSFSVSSCFFCSAASLAADAAAAALPLSAASPLTVPPPSASLGVDSSMAPSTVPPPSDFLGVDSLTVGTAIAALLFPSLRFS